MKKFFEGFWEFTKQFTAPFVQYCLLIWAVYELIFGAIYGWLNTKD